MTNLKTDVANALLQEIHNNLTRGGQNYENLKSLAETYAIVMQNMPKTPATPRGLTG